MGIYVNIDLDRQYDSLYARRAGYLPADRKALHAWHRWLGQEVETSLKTARGTRLKPSVAAMSELIRRDGIVRMYVQQMIDQQAWLRDPEGKPIPKSSVIRSVDDMLAKLNYIVTYAPWYSDPSHFPMSSLFVYVMMTPAGESLFRNAAYNESLRGVLAEWCAYLDSPLSLEVITASVAKQMVGWLSPQAYEGMKLWEFLIRDFSDKHWGFRSYNDYFHREILNVVTPDQKPPTQPYEKIWSEHTAIGDVPRPVAGPGDPRIVVSANDGQVWKIADKVKAEDRFWLKGQPYSLVNVLNGHQVDRFVGGRVFQSFLSGANYHRWHSPIEGTVRRAEVVNGLMFSDAESAGWDTSAGTASQGYEASVNTRGLVFVESPLESIGMVCVIPIGITEISSVTIKVKQGQKVKKGQELGFFSYGGSTLALVFQPGAIERFSKPVGQDIEVNGQIAVAR